MNRIVFILLLFVMIVIVAVANGPFVIKNMNSDSIMYVDKICHKNDTVLDVRHIKWDKSTSVMQVRDTKTNKLHMLRASDSKQYNPESPGYRDYIPASVRGQADTGDFYDLAEYVGVIDLFDEWTVKTEFPTDSTRYFSLTYHDGDPVRQSNLHDSLRNEIRITRNMFLGCPQSINVKLWYMDEDSTYLVSDSIRIQLWNYDVSM